LSWSTAGHRAPGKAADLVLLDANPLTDITNVRRIRAVVVAGRFMDREELDRLLVQARIAAAQP
jgi:imidazolonepropionase-like amidohydrolase